MDLLKKLCAIPAPSGEEYKVRDFILQYVSEHNAQWYSQPEIIYGDEFQDSLILVFGRPRTAIFAHMDSVGYTVKYNKELIRIGGSMVDHGIQLVGCDSKGTFECTTNMKSADEGTLLYECEREIDRGTSLTYKPDFRETDDFITSCYLDNRLGIYTALKTAETLENGAIVFSCYEEHGGGNAQNLAQYLWERYKIRQALISDITWITEGVEFGKGAAISLRDSSIPRRLFVNKIVDIARKSGIPFQLEVESSGGSDGAIIQRSSAPIDWCFIGAGEDNVHSPDETVHKADIESMIALYKELMDKL